MADLNIHHVGFWVDDVDEMVSFLQDILGFKLLTRTAFDDKGERLFVDVGNQATIEILYHPDSQPRPNVPPHGAPGDMVIGMPHICFRVFNLRKLETKIHEQGYKILNKFPKNDSDIVTGFELGIARAIWFVGPSDISFELFEFEEEIPFEEL